MTLPKHFLWGASTASYQIEGAWDQDGKGESIWDRMSHTPGRIKNAETGDIACDHYRLWKEDVDLISSMGLNAYRFSLSWPRMMPEGRGAINQKGIDFYSRLIDALLAKGITPLVTMHHWDLPQRLQDGGGWLNRRTCDYFADYAALCVKSYGDRVKQWLTINEPNVIVWCGHIDGSHAPSVKDRATGFQVGHHLALAHARALKACRAIDPHASYGYAPNAASIQPISQSPADLAEAASQFEEGTRWDLDPFLLGKYPEATFERRQKIGEAPLLAPGDLAEMNQKSDFLGLNYYFSRYVGKGIDGKSIEDASQLGSAKSDLGWPDHPQPFELLIKQLYQEYKLPIVITESGMALFNEKVEQGLVHDARRVAYVQGHVKAAENARTAGADVRGFCVWSLMDNFEWAMGYEPRFGLVHVDYKTQKRTVKDSGLWLGKHIKDSEKA